ncbi:GNAT family N-acetyltransferase [Capnocytophaga sp. ARDL2]|uniref:GNAT family N-acetyltransferase n=1 Tax=Capnocytophaga sp. ARDL2 TaxID=3238809 RepID=UPI003558EC56
MIEIKEISADETIDLRHLVLRNDMPREESVFEGDYEKETKHFGAFEDGKLIGVVSYHKKDTNNYKVNDVYRLTGLAIVKSHQGKGIGRELVETSLRKVTANKAAFIWCFARDFAVKFYVKLGFSLKIQEVLIPHIGSHRIMFKFITKDE